MELLDFLYDERMQCFSLMFKMPVKDYLSFVDETYQNRGGIQNQRGPLKTASAKIIRERMVKDVEKGAVLPPIVIGVLTDEEYLSNHQFSNSQIIELIEKVDKDRVSIIDGMQRTTALLEAKDHLENRFVRIDVWLANKIQALTYRMLVLNTGQIPWDLRRQVEVVYEPLITEIESIITKDYPQVSEYFNIIKKDDNARRKTPGEYHASDTVEMYLAFSLKTEKVAMRNILAEEFSKLDMMQAMLNQEFVSIFVNVFSLLARLDIAMGEHKNIGPESLKDGKDLFKSVAAKVGFMAAAAQKIFGIAGRDLSVERQVKSHKIVIDKVNNLINYISDKENQDKLNNFFDFEILAQRLEDLPKGSKIGDKQRELYLSSFKVLFSEDFDLDEPNPSLGPLWRGN
ncbi:hypothetical protein Q763_09235 [Flavobacterium beibuense F44-8]|uniref:DUF262 domain-containing protein n=1 Tax=Flavobacterium beibuense F44-8 TaxID=1406840 RepID=A0A0A2LYT1_9FLAO|nr:hypothetical protein [Flavobacterium beibuense]KGO81255.1 hypothetical protein Q763_09235 [Flavobacterium beibuense F44-8]